MKKSIVSTDILDRVWNDWLEQQPMTSYERNYILGRPFGVMHRRSNKQERFEDWLFSQGATIRRVNKKFHIEFSDPSKASYFLLRWS